MKRTTPSLFACWKKLDNDTELEVSIRYLYNQKIITERAGLPGIFLGLLWYLLIHGLIGRAFAIKVGFATTLL